jgi:hypothetical protein
MYGAHRVCTLECGHMFKCVTRVLLLTSSSTRCRELLPIIFQVLCIVVSTVRVRLYLTSQIYFYQHVMQKGWIDAPDQGLQYIIFWQSYGDLEIASLYGDCMEPGCTAGSHTNNLPVPTNLTGNRYLNKNVLNLQRCNCYTVLAFDEKSTFNFFYFICGDEATLLHPHK